MVIIENKFNFTVGSHLDYDQPVAVIHYDCKLVAIISQEEGCDKLKIKIYPPKDDGYWEFEFRDFIEVIIKSKDSLKFY